MWVTVALLWLFVINLGTAFGTWIYEARIIGPQWASSPPEFVLRWMPRPRAGPSPGGYSQSFHQEVSYEVPLR